MIQMLYHFQFLLHQTLNYLSLPGGPHLPLTELLDHMMMVVSHKRLGTWFGKDYSQILLDYILTVPHYVVHITSTKWDGKASR